ncbi:MAG: pirin [Bacillota bacterium]|nr:pirin [Bacillota bacterium]
MKEFRTIKRVVKGQPAQDGAGVKLVRVFGQNDVKDFDPFLMLDAFDSVDPLDYIRGFPWHPHRGIETITYLIDGKIEHGDSLGNNGFIGSGDCQWMTAGSGIIHQEMPKPSSRMLGVQLWLNLPQKDKMTHPQYHDMKSSDIPVISEEGAVIRLISGKLNGYAGAMEGDYVKPLYLDADVAPGKEWTFETNPEDNLFLYILKGAGAFGSEEGDYAREKSAVLFEAGNRFRVRAAEEGIRFLLLAAKPLKEPIAWGGPIVMNTREELELAFRELDHNTFIKEAQI